MIAQFETFWNHVNQEYACFQGIDVDWVALRDRYHSEIEAGVSHGRFTAIMNHLAFALRDPRTVALDFTVNRFDMLQPGRPLFAVTPRGDVTRFGAALTPLPDSSLLVYAAIPSHPLDLVPGDIVLGYDGVPWKRLYPELLAAELPICGGTYGASPSSFTHSMLASAGVNWHLFTTIDVVKFASGDTVHLPVAPLANVTQPVPVYEQLPVPGVPMPIGGVGGHASEQMKWGIVQGTQVGYIYLRVWSLDADVKFANAIDSLVNVHHVDGLIFDLRTHFGGSTALAYPGLAKLFGTTVNTIAFDQRCTPDDHFTLCPAPGLGPDTYAIHGSAAKTYNRPIAVLVGPGTYASGEQVANLLRFHPRTRVFGKPTCGAFNITTDLALPINLNWAAGISTADAYRTNDPGDHLTHDEFPVDEPVWLTRETVAHGEDNVATAALRWIAEQTTATLMASFDAARVDRGVELRWSFGEPARVTNAAVERALQPTGPWSAASVSLASDGDVTIALDGTAVAGTTYYYRLLVTLTDGSRVTFGPVASNAAPALAETRLDLSPNPASASTRVDFSISHSGPVHVEVVDVAGRVVSRLLDESKSPGRYSLIWDLRERSGARVPAGIYFVRLHSGGREVRQKLVRVS